MRRMLLVEKTFTLLGGFKTHYRQSMCILRQFRLRWIIREQWNDDEEPAVELIFDDV